MVSHSLFWHYLWLAPHLLQLVLAAVIIKRRLHRQFPLFLSYTLYQAFSNLVLFALDHSGKVSADAFHLAINFDAVVSIALRFAVIYEIFVVVIQPYEALKRLGSLIVQLVLLAFLVISLLVAAYGPAAEYATRLISLYIAMSRATSIVQCGLLLLLFLFSSYFGISWRSFVFGIASGLGFYLAVQLALVAVASHFNVSLANTIDMSAYHVSVLAWLFFAWKPQRAGVVVKSVPRHQLESWNVELERLLQR